MRRGDYIATLSDAVNVSGFSLLFLLKKQKQLLDTPSLVEMSLFQNVHKLSVTLGDEITTHHKKIIIVIDASEIWKRCSTNQPLSIL